jgi:radical SAM protein with 4Fe4S-binding SPASM domain
MELNNIGVQVSLDDLENGKPLINGKSSSKKVLANIQKLQTRNIRASVNTVLDIEKTKDLTRMANFISSFNNIDWGLNASYTEKDSSKISEVIKIFDDCIFQLVKRGFDIYNKLRFYNTTIGPGRGGCSAGVNSFAIGTNLEVWSCQSLCDREKIGYFDEDIKQTLMAAGGNAYFRERRMRAECSDCSILGLCRGGCRATHESDEINDTVCEIRRNIIGKLASGYYTNQKRRQENQQIKNCTYYQQQNVCTSPKQQTHCEVEHDHDHSGLETILNEYTANAQKNGTFKEVETPLLD